jgi:phosphate uptake regulator
MTKYNDLERLGVGVCQSVRDAERVKSLLDEAHTLVFGKHEHLAKLIFDALDEAVNVVVQEQDKYDEHN